MLLKRSLTLLKTMDPVSNLVLTHSYSGCLLGNDQDCSCELKPPSSVHFDQH